MRPRVSLDCWTTWDSMGRRQLRWGGLEATRFAPEGSMRLGNLAPEDEGSDWQVGQ